MADGSELASPEAEPETGIWVQAVYLGRDLWNTSKGEGVEQGSYRNQPVLLSQLPL